MVGRGKEVTNEEERERRGQKRYAAGERLAQGNTNRWTWEHGTWEQGQAERRVLGNTAAHAVMRGVWGAVAAGGVGGSEGDAGEGCRTAGGASWGGGFEVSARVAGMGQRPGRCDGATEEAESRASQGRPPGGRAGVLGGSMRASGMSVLSGRGPTVVDEVGGSGGNGGGGRYADAGWPDIRLQHGFCDDDQVGAPMD